MRPGKIRLSKPKPLPTTGFTSLPYVIEEDFFTAAQPGQEIAASENLVAPHEGALLRKMETTGARHRRRATT